MANNDQYYTPPNWEALQAFLRASGAQAANWTAPYGMDMQQWGNRLAVGTKAGHEIGKDNRIGEPTLTDDLWDYQGYDRRPTAVDPKGLGAVLPQHFVSLTPDIPPWDEYNLADTLVPYIDQNERWPRRGEPFRGSLSNLQDTDYGDLKRLTDQSQEDWAREIDFSNRTSDTTIADVSGARYIQDWDRNQGLRSNIAGAELASNQGEQAINNPENWQRFLESFATAFSHDNVRDSEQYKDARVAVSRVGGDVRRLDRTIQKHDYADQRNDALNFYGDARDKSFNTLTDKIGSPLYADQYGDLGYTPEQIGSEAAGLESDNFTKALQYLSTLNFDGVFDQFTSKATQAAENTNRFAGGRSQAPAWAGSLGSASNFQEYVPKRQFANVFSENERPYKGT